MSEVKVEKQKGLARRETSAASPFREFFQPMFPLGKLFGLNPFAVMREFSNEMDQLFRPEAMTDTWSPRSDVQFCNGNLVVTAELPGLRKEDVKVEVTDDALVIEGERKLEHKEDHEGYHRYERSYGKFYRSIPLPEGARSDQTTAELNEGVLKVTVPAPEARKGREIPIEEPKEKRTVAP